MRAVVLGLMLLAILGVDAFAKPKIAILGLEVVGNLEPEQVKVAKQLTNALRERVGAGTGPYELAPNSDKELVDEKLMNNCGTEALTCMAPIGAALKADYLMFGKIEKVDKGYHVTIKLMRVATKLPLPTFSEIVSTADLKNDPKGVAKRAYSMMTATDEGTVTIRVANVERATVYLDDEPVGTTSSGVLTIPVPEGRHRLAVVATEKGWKRHEEELTINAGDQRNIPVELVRGSGQGGAPASDASGGGGGPGSELAHTQEGATSDTGGGRTGWRVLFGASVAVGLAGGALWLYGYSEIGAANDEHLKLCGMLDPPVAGLDACKDTLERLPSGSEQIAGRNAANEQGKDGRQYTIYGVVAVSVGVALGAVSLYKGFLSTPEKRVVGARRSPRRNLLVTPVIAPSGGGATLRLEW